MPRWARRQISPRHGLACTPRIAHKWANAQLAPLPAPALGEVYCLPELAVTLRRLAEDGPSVVYEGEVAAAIAAATWLSEDDLLAHRSEWVEPLSRAYRGIEVCELPPNGQGAAALLALALYEELDPGTHAAIESMKLALADTRAVVHDGPLPDDFFDESRLAARRALIRPDSVVVRRPGTAARRHDVPVRRRWGRDGRVADPERLRLVRLWHRGSGNGDRAPESCSRLQCPSGTSERAGRAQAAVPYDHPGDVARGRRIGRTFRCDGRRDAGSGPLPGRQPARRRRRRPTGRARRTSLAGGGRWRRRARARTRTPRARAVGDRVTTPVSRASSTGSASGRSSFVTGRLSSGAPTAEATATRPASSRVLVRRTREPQEGYICRYTSGGMVPGRERD